MSTPTWVLSILTFAWEVASLLTPLAVGKIIPCVNSVCKGGDKLIMKLHAHTHSINLTHWITLKPWFKIIITIIIVPVLFVGLVINPKNKQENMCYKSLSGLFFSAYFLTFRYLLFKTKFGFIWWPLVFPLCNCSVLLSRTKGSKLAFKMPHLACFPFIHL